MGMVSVSALTMTVRVLDKERNSMDIKRIGARQETRKNSCTIELNVSLDVRMFT